MRFHKEQIVVLQREFDRGTSRLSDKEILSEIDSNLKELDGRSCTRTLNDRCMQKQLLCENNKGKKFSAAMVMMHDSAITLAPYWEGRGLEGGGTLS